MRPAKDLLAGLIFAAFGAAGVLVGAGYRMGSAARMGPGWMPRLLAWSLLALGAVLVVRALAAGDEPVERGRWRPLLCVTAAIVAFALLIDRAGLLAAGAAAIALGAFGGSEFRWGEAALLAVALLAACSAIFVWGLGLPLALLPP
jgi:putative tricarboxylic transport membrane protein